MNRQAILDVFPSDHDLEFRVLGNTWGMEQIHVSVYHIANNN